MAKKTGFDLRKFDKFVAQISNKKNSPALKIAHKQWGIRYLAWIKRLFVKNSSGAGAWPPLKRKRKRGNSSSARILRDTGVLFKALTIGSAGNLFKHLKNGIRVGFGGPSRHPRSKATIADIAKMHNNGEGNLPKRKILYWPDNKFIKQMLNDLKRTIKNIGKNL